jgi:imidazolonepropionase-like amidohydrolase
MTADQALHAATLSAARLLGVDGDLGSVEVGKLADLVVVDGDVSTVDGIGSRIGSVYQNGVPV